MPKISLVRSCVATISKRRLNRTDYTFLFTPYHSHSSLAGGENALQSLSPSDRAKIAENRQVMRAYLISKLVAPRYDVDHDGKINPEHFKKGHLGSDDMEQRQRTVVHLYS